MPKNLLVVAFIKFLLILMIFFSLSGVLIYSAFQFDIVEGNGLSIFEVTTQKESIKDSISQTEDIALFPYIIKPSTLGEIFEPNIAIKVKKTDNTYINLEFLLDSGAVVSTLPKSFADELGRNLENAERIKLRGFGNSNVWGYVDNINIALNDLEEITIPMIFAEGSTKQIIGRQGFFDIYTVVFDHENKLIRIRKNK